MYVCMYSQPDSNHGLCCFVIVSSLSGGGNIIAPFFLGGQCMELIYRIEYRAYSSALHTTCAAATGPGGAIGLSGGCGKCGWEEFQGMGLALRSTLRREQKREKRLERGGYGYGYVWYFGLGHFKIG